MAIPRLSIYARLPPPELFSWPSGDQDVLQPKPSRDLPWLQPFTIPPSLFHKICDIKVPVTIVAVYLTSVIYLNRVNESRRNKPWCFAKTSVFKYLVVFHNIFLALFSAFVFYNVIHSVRKFWPSTTEPYFRAHVADLLCRITSPDELRGPNISLEEKHAWYSSQGSSITDIQPSVQPRLGGLWDDGGGYFAWLFYLSKFYEVIDTFILLAKGKRSSMLQTYHHSGVILCGWGAIRYTSPPALVAMLLNSAIHTLMVCVH
jgi:hypothetical protein